MASTSKYVQLTSQVLLEYIYQDPVTPDVIDTDLNGARNMILYNSYTETNFLFTEDNPYVPTGNYRTYSAIPINESRSRYAYLTTNMPLNYLDYDTNLPNVASLLAQLTTAPNVPVEFMQYDTIRLHLVAGFTFASQGDGIIFEMLLTDKRDVKHNLTSITYLNSDNYEVVNPSEFIVGERLYNKYIELKIPAVSYLADQTFSNPSVASSLSYDMTDGVGVKFSSMIDFSLKNIITTETINGYKYFLTGEATTASISKTDEYSGLSASIEESTDGDYFELYGKYNGVIYNDFIAYLDSLPNTKIVVFHDIRVWEQIGNVFDMTSENSFLQSSSYEVPYRFRPIIINSAVATSYRIDYTLRIYNSFDNSQIIRQAQYASFDVKKYGRRMRKINLGVEPVVAKVYNTLPDNKPIVNLTSYNRMKVSQDGGGSTQVEYITSFADRNKVSASVSSVKITPAVQQQGDVLPTASGDSMLSADIPLTIEQISSTDKVYQQGEGPIGITPFDNFYQFVIYNNANSSAVGMGSPQLLDLTQVGNLYLNFFDKATGTRIKVQNYTNVKQINPVNGEVVFKIPAEMSIKILGLSENSYYISSILETGGGGSEETLLYSGKWYDSITKSGIVVSDSIENLTTEYTKLQEFSTRTITGKDTLISTQKSTIDYQTQYIVALESKISELGGNVTSIQNSLSQAADTIAIDQANLAIAVSENSSTNSNATTSEAAAEQVKGSSTKFIKIAK
jgi:hypothetical protein